MKKLSFIFILLMFVAMISLEGSQGNFLDQKAQKGDESGTIPDNIFKDLQNSCFECHTTGGRKKALSHLNFSEWDNYAPEKKAEKASEIIEVLKTGDMPPKLYSESHPDRVPTAAQKDSLIRWAETLVKK